MQQEMTMLAPYNDGEVELAARSVHRIVDGKGLRVTCLEGVVWITQERDRRDLILLPGQSFVLDRPGVAVVFALRDATISVASAWQMPTTASVPVQYPERACA
jgi:hypothetical protein